MHALGDGGVVVENEPKRNKEQWRYHLRVLASPDSNRALEAGDALHDMMKAEKKKGQWQLFEELVKSAYPESALPPHSKTILKNRLAAIADGTDKLLQVAQLLTKDDLSENLWLVVEAAANTLKFDVRPMEVVTKLFVENHKAGELLERLKKTFNFSSDSAAKLKLADFLEKKKEQGGLNLEQVNEFIVKLRAPYQIPAIRIAVETDSKQQADSHKAIVSALAENPELLLVNPAAHIQGVLYSGKVVVCTRTKCFPNSEQSKRKGREDLADLYSFSMVSSLLKAVAARAQPTHILLTGLPTGEIWKEGESPLPTVSPDEVLFMSRGQPSESEKRFQEEIGKLYDELARSGVTLVGIGAQRGESALHGELLDDAKVSLLKSLIKDENSRIVLLDYGSGSSLKGLLEQAGKSPRSQEAILFESFSGPSADRELLMGLARLGAKMEVLPRDEVPMMGIKVTDQIGKLEGADQISYGEFNVVFLAFD